MFRTPVIHIFTGNAGIKAESVGINTFFVLYDTGNAGINTFFVLYDTGSVGISTFFVLYNAGSVGINTFFVFYDTGSVGINTFFVLCRGESVPHLPAKAHKRAKFYK